MTVSMHVVAVLDSVPSRLHSPLPIWEKGPQAFGPRRISYPLTGAPLVVGAVHARAMLPPVLPSPVGAAGVSGGPAGVTADEALEGDPAPKEFTAVTRT